MFVEAVEVLWEVNQKHELQTTTGRPEAFKVSSIDDYFLKLW